MTPEEFREHGKRVVDWIADYLVDVEKCPVRSPARPGEVRSALPAHAPERGADFDAVLADMERIVLPGITHWQHPNFFAYFPANASGPAILGDLLSAGLGVQGMVWATSPACTELETVVVDWLAELLGLPGHFRTDGAGGGVIQDSASSAVLVALLAALHRVRKRTGSAPRPVRYTMYVSGQTHSSVERAGRICGVGTDNVRIVDVDPNTLAMDPRQLERLISADIAAGAVPVFVCATIGTTSTTAIDPVRAIGEICRSHDVWLHVDAAYAGVAAICPEMRWINDGVAEYADSYASNAHKWLLTNFDCGLLWVADRQPLIGALSALPEYLRNTASESGEVIDYRDWQVPLGRRFRALKLWSVIRWYGAEGLRAHIRAGIAMADEFAALVSADPNFEVLDPHHFGLVCFRPLWTETDPERADELTMRLMESLNDSGDMFLSHTKVRGRVVLRMAIGAPATGMSHVRAAWSRIRAVRSQFA
ncbi:pyridoxal-dependent decarboxylase [Amycolatopsis marina]|nr:pyridoxal-dependent decarboxylase [Amycolatopsis marina]